MLSNLRAPQDHYDFGMRSLKSVLVMAGAARRRAGEDLAAGDGGGEDGVLISAIRDANLPKFTSEVTLAVVLTLHPRVVVCAGSQTKRPRQGNAGCYQVQGGRGSSDQPPLVPARFVAPANNTTANPQDAALFEALIRDLFPAAPPSPLCAPELRAALCRALSARGLQPAEGLVSKAVQLRETMGVRFGVMLIGQAGEGRSWPGLPSMCLPPRHVFRYWPSASASAQ